MTKKQEENLPVAPTFRKLEVGEKAEFPLRRVNLIRATATNLSYELGRRYTVHVVRENNLIEVTRLK